LEEDRLRNFGMEPMERKYGNLHAPTENLYENFG